MDETEKLLRQTHDARLVHMNEQVLFPMLTERIDQAVEALCNDFRSGKQPNILHIASIAAAKDLLIDLTALTRRGEQAATKLNKGKQP